MNRKELELENKILKDALREIHQLTCNPEQACPDKVVGSIQFLSSQERFNSKKEQHLLLEDCRNSKRKRLRNEKGNENSDISTTTVTDNSVLKMEDIPSHAFRIL